MTVGIFRSRIFTAGRTFLRDGRGVSAVETAFAFPVILAAFFIIVEFANMALTIQVGESAVSSALLRFRDAGELGASAENDIRQGIAAYSFGYLKPSNVSRVTVEAYESSCLTLRCIRGALPRRTSIGMFTASSSPGRSTLRSLFSVM